MWAHRPDTVSPFSPVLLFSHDPLCVEKFEDMSIDLLQDLFLIIRTVVCVYVSVFVCWYVHKSTSVWGPKVLRHPTGGHKSLGMGSRN